MLLRFKIEIDIQTNPNSSFAIKDFKLRIRHVNNPENVAILRPSTNDSMDASAYLYIKEFYFICDEPHILAFQDLLTNYDAITILTLPSLENLTLHFGDSEVLDKLY